MYFWGDAFYVKPVTDPGVETVDTLIPPGAWFDFWTDQRYEGGNRVDVPVTLRTIPVFVRAGSFVPMTPPIQSTQDYSSEALTLHYYADESVTESSGRMYEDDGKTHGTSKSGNFELLEFSAQRDGEHGIGLARNGSYDGMPDGRRHGNRDSQLDRCGGLGSLQGPKSPGYTQGRHTHDQGGLGPSTSRCSRSMSHDRR